VLRLAREAWLLQYSDAPRSLALAEQAFERAVAASDAAAECRARLARGFHWIRFDTPEKGEQELTQAQQCFKKTGDRAGAILATVGISRCWWRQGRFREALDLVLPLRGEGLRLLKGADRSVLLNGIAGCYSSLGQSAEAFAYMYQALRESDTALMHGYDVVLYTNLSHELLQLGDYVEALRYVEEGIKRCAGLNNARLLAVLLVNRVICLTETGRPREALPDIQRVLDLPTDVTGRGVTAASFEILAIAALRAGELALGADLVARAAGAAGHSAIPDERIENLVAEAELLCAQGKPADAAARLEATLPLPADLSLRVRCLFHEALACANERIGDAARALAQLREWQRLYVERARLASQARYQAASLQTELLWLQQERDDIEQRRQAAEQARVELETVNQQLSQKIDEVQALRAALERQAVRDFLTGLFNRRHLNDVMPSMLALAERDRQPLALVVIDLDHFKAVNDRYGHLVGDMLLAAFGKLLATRMRKSDIACRYGGEEFCLLMPRTDAQAAQRKVVALMKLWRSASFQIEDGNGGSTLTGLTFSAGVSDSTRAGGSADELLRAADTCVLEAKRLGRERIVVHAAPVPSESAPAGD
jgi:diguanylate cyclase (GGDEF)-like protein